MNISFCGKILLMGNGCQYTIKDANGNEKPRFCSNPDHKGAEDIIVNTDHIAYTRTTVGGGEGIELVMSNGDSIHIKEGFNQRTVELASLLPNDETICHTPGGDFSIKKYNNIQKLLDVFKVKKENY